MALASASFAASFDQSAGEFLDLSNELAFINQHLSPFLDFIGIGGVAIETTHSWMEDSLNSRSTLSEASADGILTASGVDTALTVAAGEGLKFRIGDIFIDTAAGKNERMQVTLVATDVLTIVRAYGSTSVETHGSGTTAFNIQIITHGAQEGQDAPDDVSTTRSKVSNYTQIFHEGIKINDTLQRALQAGVPNELSYQIMNRIKEIKEQIDASMIYGIKSATVVGSDTVLRYMAGLIEFITAAGGNTDDSAVALTPTVINSMVEDIYDDGGNPNFILVGANQKRAISSFDEAYRRSTVDDRTAGYIVDSFVSDILGTPLRVIVDPNVSNDIAIVGDSSKLKVCSFLPLRAENLARTGIANKAQVSGQFTIEVKNALEAFAYHNNLTTRA